MEDIKKIIDIYGVNEEQAQALDIDSNIVLHAGAGSGKTRVLTRRFLRMLLEKNINVRNIVVITFTKKAALEMKERILELVDEFILKEKDEERIKRLKTIKEELPIANISTFHSFCDSIIREYSYMLEIDPNYKIMDEIDEATKLDDVIERVIEEALKDNEEEFKVLFNEIGIDYVFKKNINKELKNLYLQIRANGDNFENVLEKTKNNIQNYKGNLDENEVNYQKLNQLVASLLFKIDEEYIRLKKNEGLLDFSDLEMFTLKLLKNKEFKEVKAKLQSTFKYFLVDEFQDTNEIQLEIIYGFVKNDDGKIEDGKLFVVGDVKQSIYLFRGANYKVFDKVTEDIINQGKKVSLNTNYRSHENLINLFNELFINKLEKYELAKVPEDEKFKVKGESYIGYKNWEHCKEETLKDKFDRIKTEEELDELLKEEKIKEDEELNYIAETIKELANKGIKYKDIAILVRKNRDVADIENKFKEANIPYTLFKGSGFFETQEIKDMINILKFMYEYRNKKAFIGVLRSPFIGLSDDIIMEIFKKEIEFKRDKIIEIESVSNNKFYVNIINKLFDLKNAAYFYNVNDFISLIIKELNIEQILLSLENGVQRFRNVEKLLSIAKEFEDKGIFSTNEFIDYIENMREISDNEGQAFLDTEESDAVKIMTIHASKGLEFEAVFLPRLSYKLNSNISDKFIYDKYGMDGKKYGIIYNRKENKKDLLINKVKEIKKKEEAKEEYRILYVAATRAIRFLMFTWKEKKDNTERIYGKEEDKLDILLNEIIQKIYGKTNNLIPVFNTKKNDEDDNIDEKVEIITDKLNFTPRPIISISRYMIYKDCPRQYYFRYIANINEKHLYSKFSVEEEEIDEDIKDFNEEEERAKRKLGSLEKGTIIHSILEEMVNGREIDIDEIFYGIEHTKNENLIEDINKAIKNYHKIEENIKNIIKGEKIKSETEFEFTMPLINSSIIMTGAIDRIDIYKEGEGLKAYIIDYKTNKTKGKNKIEDLKEHYKPQFIAYSYAFENIFKDIKLDGIFLYLLDKGEAVEITFSEEEKKKVLEEIADIFYKIEKSSKFEDFMPCTCQKNCTYKFICNYDCVK